MTPRVINAAPSLEKAEIHGIDDQRPMSSKIMGMLGRIFIETIPQWLAVGAMLALIFGGCCSNVFALEAIIQSVLGISPAFNPDELRSLTCMSLE
jgi:UDP-xylose/UDP-N-acetylglucosamine transporter B4